MSNENEIKELENTIDTKTLQDVANSVASNAANVATEQVSTGIVDEALDFVVDLANKTKDNIVDGWEYVQDKVGEGYDYVVDLISDLNEDQAVTQTEANEATTQAGNAVAEAVSNVQSTTETHNTEELNAVAEDINEKHKKEMIDAGLGNSMIKSLGLAGVASTISGAVEDIFSDKKENQPQDNTHKNFLDKTFDAISDGVDYVQDAISGGVDYVQDAIGNVLDNSMKDIVNSTLNNSAQKVDINAQEQTPIINNNSKEIL